jgi:hypothetical protein
MSKRIKRTTTIEEFEPDEEMGEIDGADEDLGEGDEGEEEKAAESVGPRRTR